jgi:hypothetical protein
MTQENKKVTIMGYVVPGQGDMECIKDLLDRLASSGNSDTEADLINDEINQYPLEVKKTQGYELLLGTGGPATRIVGKLNEHGEPETAELQGQDWGTQWERTELQDEETLLQFAQHFYFGE